MIRMNSPSARRTILDEWPPLGYFALIIHFKEPNP